MMNNSIRADASARNLLDNLGITELLNQSGITEVMINRPHGVAGNARIDIG